MKIKTISFKRINNIGNFNSEHLEMFAELDENENAQDAAKLLIAEVETALGLRTEKEPPFGDNDEDEF